MGVLRFDFGKLAKATRTPAGGVLVPAGLTRSGVLEYRRADGSIRRELRPEEEVFHVDSLASLRHAPVTDLHPSELVTASNWSQYSIGTVTGETKRDGRTVSSELLVNKAEAISKIDSGDRKECSCGYTCDIREDSGVRDGEKYDVIQTNIRYNHVAIGPENWARAGKEASFRLDSNAAFSVAEEELPKKEKKKKTMKISLDGISYDTEKDPEAFLQAYAKHQAEEKDRAKEREVLRGKFDSMKKDKEELQAKFDSVDVKTLVKERVALEKKALELVPKFDCTDLSDREVMVGVLTKFDEKFDANGKSDDYIFGAFSAKEVKEVKADSDDHGKVRGQGKVVKTDSDKMFEEARKDKQAREDAWKQPLLVSVKV
jgi:hypothetical protein